MKPSQFQKQNRILITNQLVVISDPQSLSTLKFPAEWKTKKVLKEQSQSEQHLQIPNIQTEELKKFLSENAQSLETNFSIAIDSDKYQNDVLSSAIASELPNLLHIKSNDYIQLVMSQIQRPQVLEQSDIFKLTSQQDLLQMMEKFNTQLKIEKSTVPSVEVEYPLLVCRLSHKTEFFLAKDAQTVIKVGEQYINYLQIKNLVQRVTQSENISYYVKEGLESGISTKCDLTVGDIYGSDSEQYIKIPSNILASSLGKVNQQRYTKNDIIKSLINIFAMETSQMASLITTLHQIKQFYYIDDVFQDQMVLAILQKLLQFYSGGKLDPVFISQSEQIILQK